MGDIATQNTASAAPVGVSSIAPVSTPAAAPVVTIQYTPNPAAPVSAPASSASPWGLPKNDITPNGLPKVADSTAVTSKTNGFEYNAKTEDVFGSPKDAAAKPASADKSNIITFDESKSNFSAPASTPPVTSETTPDSVVPFKTESDAPTSTPASFSAPTVSSISGVDSSNGSLAEIEKQITDQKADLEKQIKSLQDKSQKTSEVLSKISSLKREESSLLEQAKGILK